jgi:hypothetical protein
VVLYSPLLAEPFFGRDAVAAAYATLFEVFDELEIRQEVDAGKTHVGNTHVFYWRGTVDAWLIEGVDLVRSDAGGGIYEIRVFMRPLARLGIFMASVGAAMGRQDGGLRGALARIAAPPLRWLFQLLQIIATRTGHGRA